MDQVSLYKVLAGGQQPPAKQPMNQQVHMDDMPVVQTGHPPMPVDANAGGPTPQELFRQGMNHTLPQRIQNNR